MGRIGFPMLCPAAGREEAEFAAEKSNVGPSATVPLCLTVSWVLPGCSSTERGRAQCEKGTTKSRCGGAAGAPSCRSPPCRQRNACLDSCHGNKFILRPGQRLAAGSWSSLWHPQQDPGRQEGWGEVSCLQGALPASKFRLVVSLLRKYRRAAGRSF